MMLRSVKKTIERVLLKRGLTRREQMVRSVLESLPDGIVIVNESGIITFANAVAGELLEETVQELTGRRWDIDFGSGRYRELQFGGKSGGIRDVEMHAVSIVWEDDKADLISLRDITIRKEMEAERNKATKLEGLSLLAGGVAHEFNNLLTGIMGNISIAQMNAEAGSAISKSLEKAERSCRAASDAVQRLMPFARSGKPAKARVPMKIFMRECLRSYSTPPGIELGISLQDDLWDTEIDVGQIKAAILALVENSVLACPEGGLIQLVGENIRVEDGGLTKLSAGPYLKMSVADSGVGIKEEILHRIFEPFFSTREEADGLGLAVAYSVVKRHGGNIVAFNRPDGGASVEIYLPAIAENRVEGEDTVAAPASLPETETKLEGSSPGTRKQGAILLMDDEEAILDVAGRMIEILGYNVVRARDGEEALEEYLQALENDRVFDAVILDLKVPGGMGGAQTFEKIREIDPDVVAIASSGYPDDPVMNQYQDYGFKAVVPKPYNSSELKKALDDVVA